MDNNEFSRSLKAYFASKGITQAMIARDIDCATSYIARLFNSKQPFGKKQAAQFEQLYGISAAWLLTGQGPMMAGGEAPPSVVAEAVTHGDNSPAVAGSGNTVAGCDCGECGRRMDALTDEVRRLAEAVERMNEEHTAFLRIIEAMAVKKQ